MFVWFLLSSGFPLWSSDKMRGTPEFPRCSAWFSSRRKAYGPHSCQTALRPPGVGGSALDCAGIWGFSGLWLESGDFRPILHKRGQIQAGLRGNPARFGRHRPNLADSELRLVAQVKANAVRLAQLLPTLAALGANPINIDKL